MRISKTPAMAPAVKVTYHARASVNLIRPDNTPIGCSSFSNRDKVSSSTKKQPSKSPPLYIKAPM